MKDFDLTDELDLEMDRRLIALARRTREPALPDAVAELPWTVQLEAPRAGPVDFLRGFGGGFARIRHTGIAFARLAATLAVAGSFLLLVGHVRTGGTAGADLIRPVSTPPPSAGAGAPAGPEVVVVTTSGVVDDVMADYVAGAVRRANRTGPRP